MKTVLLAFGKPVCVFTNIYNGTQYVIITRSLNLNLDSVYIKYNGNKSISQSGKKFWRYCDGRANCEGL